jgi:hypothetical protein
VSAVLDFGGPVRITHLVIPKAAYVRQLTIDVWLADELAGTHRVLLCHPLHASCYEVSLVDAAVPHGCRVSSNYNTESAHGGDGSSIGSGHGSHNQNGNNSNSASHSPVTTTTNSSNGMPVCRFLRVSLSVEPGQVANVDLSQIRGEYDLPRWP